MRTAAPSDRQRQPVDSDAAPGRAGVYAAGAGRAGEIRGNAEGTIRYDADRKRWEARAPVGRTRDGNLVRKKVVAPTRAAVAKRLAGLIDAHDHGRSPARVDMTVGTFLATWLDDVLPGTVAATTAAQYGDVVRRYVVPILGRKRLRSLTSRDVTAMVRQLADEGRSPNTQRLARTILRRALRWAEHDGIVDRNAAAISYGPRVPQSEGRTMTPDDARMFLASIAGHCLEAAWVTALGLGLRRGELLALTWPDVKLTGRTPTLTVNASLKRLRGYGLGGAGVGAAGSPVPAWLEHRRLKARDRWEKQQAEAMREASATAAAAAALAAARAARTPVFEAFMAVATEYIAWVDRGPADENILSDARAKVLGAYSRALLFATPRQAITINDVLAQIDEGMPHDRLSAFLAVSMRLLADDSDG